MHGSHSACSAQPQVAVNQVSTGKSGYTTYQVAVDFDRTVARDVYGQLSPCLSLSRPPPLSLSLSLSLSLPLPLARALSLALSLAIIWLPSA
eukprot:COSAG03_NODE_751_length_5994_cov_17.493130_7_plen_92_part_00